MSPSDAAAPPRLLVALAAVLVLGLGAAVTVIGLSSPEPEADTPGPLPVPAVDAPDAESSECEKLLSGLPDRLESGGQELERRELAEPAPAGAAAWGGQNPVVLRCGLPEPVELKKTSELVDIDGVEWFQAPGTGSTTWYAVDRPVYVALTLPAEAGTGVVQGVSATISGAMKHRAPRP